MKDCEEKKVDGKAAAVESKPSEQAIVRFRSHSTVARSSANRGFEKLVFSNREGISMEIVNDAAVPAS